MRRPALLWALLAALLTPALAWSAEPARIESGRLGQVRYYPPAAGRPVRGLVALISDRQGWDANADRLARHLAGEGQAALGIDLPAFVAALKQDRGDCSWVNGDLEALTRRVEEGLPFAEFRPPAIVGIGAGAEIAYAAVGQVLPNTFAGGVGLGFSDEPGIGRKLCLPTEAGGPGRPLRYGPVPDGSTPWLFTPAGDFDAPGSLRAFLAGMQEARQIGRAGSAAALIDQALARIPSLIPQPIPVTGLPIVELKPRGPGAGNRPMVVFYSGDGGWRDIDRQIGDYLADHGFLVVGFDSLRYFWRAKEPRRMAADLDALVRHYAARAHGRGVILIGYSFGADVLPFIVNRMAPDTRRQIRLISLLGIARRASFVIRLNGILGAANDDGPPTLPELMRLRDIPVQCVYGFDETDSACTEKALGGIVERVEMKGGHHFDGDYHDVADAIVAAAKGKVGG